MREDIESRRLAVEIIATLVNVKGTMAELILKPAGIPVEIYRPFLRQVDEITGKAKSKRQIAPLILDAMDKLNDGSRTVHSLIEHAASWSDFHLAADEYQARATVQKAKEAIGQLRSADERARILREAQLKDENDRRGRQQAQELRREQELLTMMFDDLEKSDEPQKRGYLLQDLLNRAFNVHGIPVIRSFTRNDGGEQIDGAFRLNNLHYLVECRWRQKVADIRDLDGLLGQVQRSGNQTIGMFLSIKGWSEHVPDLLKQNREKAILLMDGYDLRNAISGNIELADFVAAMLEQLNIRAEPYLGVTQYLKRLT